MNTVYGISVYKYMFKLVGNISQIDVEITICFRISIYFLVVV